MGKRQDATFPPLPRPTLLPSLTFSRALSPHPAVPWAPFPPGCWVSPAWVSSLTLPEHCPLVLTQLEDSLSLQSGGEKMLTKSTLVVMTTAALIIVCSLVPGLLEGGWERDEGDGAVRLEPGKPPSPAPLLCPCSPPGAPVSCLLMSLGPLAPALRPQVWRPSPQCLDLPLARGSPGGMGSRCRAGAVQSPFAPGEGEALVAHQVVRQLGHGPGHVSQPRAPSPAPSHTSGGGRGIC